MDYRVYHAVNEFMTSHSWLGSPLAAVEAWAVPVTAVATCALWVRARPGGDRKWKLASVSALAASAVALLLNQLIALAWHRSRPFAAHPSAHVWGSRSHDPSFPSDHASAAFAIAFAVLAFDRLAGGIFIAGAVVIGVGRVLVGAHYPGDVLAGVVIGAVAATLVFRLARPIAEPLVRLVERGTDPILSGARRRATSL